ncbi:MAG: phosphatase PAP2 family protein [Candidatus Omnitrophica bacterium]|nr:phosphatase PAP2 family protein [Candidatus Omnitrophota bacterium]
MINMLMDGDFPKIWTIVLVCLILYRELENGYFKGFVPYLKTVSFRPYIRILVFFGIFLVAVFFLDPFLSTKTVQFKHQTWAILVADFGGFLGRQVNPWVFLTLFYGVGILWQRRMLPRWSFGGLLSGTLTVLLASVFKFCFLRARPYAELGHLSFFNVAGILEDDRAYQSFVSGDVAIVAGISCYFLYQLRNTFFLRWLVLLLPLATGFARIYAGKHWPSDVVLAMGLGLLMAKFVSQYETALATKSAEFEIKLK